jgi:hypothetical protein
MAGEARLGAVRQGRQGLVGRGVAWLVVAGNPKKN